MSASRLPPLADVLIEALRTLPVPRRDLLLVQAAWDAAVGPEIARHGRPVALEGGTLAIEMDDDTWARGVRSFERPILEALRRRTGLHLGRIEPRAGGPRRSP